MANVDFLPRRPSQDAVPEETPIRRVYPWILASPNITETLLWRRTPVPVDAVSEPAVALRNTAWNPSKGQILESINWKGRPAVIDLSTEAPNVVNSRPWLTSTRQGDIGWNSRRASVDAELAPLPAYRAVSPWIPPAPNVLDYIGWLGKRIGFDSIEDRQQSNRIPAWLVAPKPPENFLWYRKPTSIPETPEEYRTRIGWTPDAQGIAPATEQLRWYKRRVVVEPTTEEFKARANPTGGTFPQPPNVQIPWAFRRRPELTELSESGVPRSSAPQSAVYAWIAPIPPIIYFTSNVLYQRNFASNVAVR